MCAPMTYDQSPSIRACSFAQRFNLDLDCLYVLDAVQYLLDSHSQACNSWRSLAHWTQTSPTLVESGQRGSNMADLDISNCRQYAQHRGCTELAMHFGLQKVVFMTTYMCIEWRRLRQQRLLALPELKLYSLNRTFLHSMGLHPTGPKLKKNSNHSYNFWLESLYNSH